MIIGLTGYGFVIENLPIVAVISYVIVTLPLSVVGSVFCFPTRCVVLSHILCSLSNVSCVKVLQTHSCAYS